MEKPIYISSYCVNFRDYDKLLSMMRSFPDFPAGAEFGTWWGKYADIPERLDAVIPVFKAYPSTIHSPFCDICAPEGSEKQALQRQAFEKACRQYVELGSSGMVVHTHEAALPKESGQALSKQRLLETHELLRSFGIPMTVENVGYPHKGNVLFDQEDFIRLFDELPEEIGALIDTGHAMLNRWDIVGVIKTLGPRIRGYHLNNNDGENDLHYPCFDSRGFYSEEEMEAVIRAIARYSPEAELIIEYAPGEHITNELMHGEMRRIMKVYRENLTEKP